jgi:hypothetical protein
MVGMGLSIGDFLAGKEQNLNRKSALTERLNLARGHDRYRLPARFKLAGKLLKNHVLPHVLGENYGG